MKQKRIEQNNIIQAPVFIIGHCRSGTTFLHYLMSKDPNFGYLSNAQTFCPGYMFYHLPKLIKKIIKLHLPFKRPMDDMKIGFESPQEEDRQRVRQGNAPDNMATLRKMALQLLLQHKGKSSLKKIRKRAAWNKGFLVQVLDSFNKTNF